jgi:hypothetical protein
LNSGVGIRKWEIKEFRSRNAEVGIKENSEGGMNKDWVMRAEGKGQLNSEVGMRKWEIKEFGRQNE